MIPRVAILADASAAISVAISVANSVANRLLRPEPEGRRLLGLDVFGKSILILFAEMDFLRRGGLFEVETLLSIIKDAIRPHPDKQYQRLKLPAPPYRRVQTGNICSPRLCAFVFFPNASAATSAAAHAAATATLDVFPDTKRTLSQNSRKP